jgi:hypothetical protein
LHAACMSTPPSRVVADAAFGTATTPSVAAATTAAIASNFLIAVMNFSLMNARWERPGWVLDSASDVVRTR